jgi:hypothetical protein
MQRAHQSIPATASDQRGFIFGLAAIAFAAVLVREYFVLVAVPEAPIRGDITHYVNYAWNLLHHGVFSRAAPGPDTPLPDAMRGPGYPLLLALCMWLGSTEDGSWYPLALQLNVVLGAGTCVLLALLVRRWLGTAGGLGSAAAFAFWPHHIAATGALLVEVAFGFFLVSALLFAARYAATPGKTWAIAAGLSLGYAFLINPVILLFVPLGALLLLRSAKPSGCAWLLLASIALIGPWMLRDHLLPAGQHGQSRAAMNFVQGSWPTYHKAWAFQHRDEIAAAIMDEIQREIDLLSDQPRAGLAAIGSRIAEEPGYYARWYLLDKPWLLWDWDIRLGIGDVHYHRHVEPSPLETHFLLRTLKQAYKSANPLLFALACLAAIAAAAQAGRRQPNASVLVGALIGLLFIYITAIHCVFQAEPRYATAYRWLQVALACAAVMQVAQWASWRQRDSGTL